MQEAFDFSAFLVPADAVVVRQPGEQRAAVKLMPGKARWKAFFKDQPQRFPQGIDHGDRGRVVIEALLILPIVGDQ